MAGLTKTLLSPAALTNTYTNNVYVPASALVYSVVRHIHVANKTGSSATFRLYMGATGANTAGTEVFFDQAVPPNGSFDWYTPGLKLTSTTFLVGGASAATTLTITITGDEYVV